MKFFPTPPTDNIYKFSFVFGAWMILGALIFGVWLSYKSIELEEHEVNLNSYYELVNKLDALRREIDFLERGGSYKDLGEDWNIFKSSEDAINKLKKSEALIDKRMVMYKKYIDQFDGADLRIFKHPFIVFSLMVYLFLMVSFLIFGYKGWKKTTLIDDETRSVELKIKNKSLEKLEYEIRSIRRGVVRRR